jgi:hypothetical protein
MRRSFQAVLVILMALVMIGGAAAPAMASQNRAAGSLRWVFASGSATGGKPITIRVTLWDVAPSGGTRVLLMSSNEAMKVPGMVTIPAGESEVLVKVRTFAVTENTRVMLTARLGDRNRRVTHVVLRPYLSSTTVQTRIKSGSLGKIIVRLSGIAPEGGVTVSLNSSRPSVLPVPATVFIPAGKASVSVNVPASKVRKDVDVNVTALYRGIRITKPTIVRKFKVTESTEPSATPTATADLTATAISDDLTATAEADLTATQVSIDQTATASADQTATRAADDLTATRTSDEATATQQAIDATATQVATDQTATQVSIDETATQTSIEQTATQVSINATATQQAADDMATQVSGEQTATAVSWEQTATSIADDATATQAANDATATQQAIDATATFEAGQPDVMICHATGNGTYNGLSLNRSGIVNGHYGNDSGDIIPPFEFKGQWYSQNWDEAGQAIFGNGCAEVVPAATATEVAPTATTVPVELKEEAPAVLQSMAIGVDSMSVPPGSTVVYSFCLTQPTTTDVTITWYPGQAKFDDPVNSGSLKIPAGSSGLDLCGSVPFSGLNRGNGAPTGVGNLIFVLSDGQVFYGPEVTFKGKS